MYQLDYLVKEHIEDLRREAEQERLAASAVRPQPQYAPTRRPFAATTLLWAGRQLSYWGDRLQKEHERSALR